MSIKKTLGKIGRTVLPASAYQAVVRPIGAYLWLRSLAFQQRIADQVIRHYGAVVQGGPFAGMRYLDKASDGCIVPKLIGCYEEELHGALERLLAKGYDRAIDIGCASGYYVVGFARRLPNAEIYGFDIDGGAIERCHQLVALNGVQSQVQLGEWCTHADLNRLAGPRTLVFCDIEGAEIDLIDPALAPCLRHADLIVEIHNHPNPKVGPTILERFKKSHTIEMIPTCDREPSRYPNLAILPRRLWAGAVDERRPRQQEWVVMEARCA